MSEYWKSQPKKFCDFCKCWITDNKASVDFHERGKRHNENVQKRISEIQKKSMAKEKKDAAFKSDLQAIEEAALKAFQQDAERDPTLAGQYKNAVLQKKLQEAEKVNEQGNTQESHPKAEDILPYWVEGVSPEGYTYYWNSFTGESTWDKPEGFVSTTENQSSEQQTDEQSSQVQTEDTSSSEKVTENQETNDQSTDKDVPDEEEEGGKKDKSTEEPKETKDKNATDSTEKTNDNQTNTASKKRSNPYGSWQAIQPPTKTPDLQLPEARTSYAAPPITIATEEPKIKIKFKEKTVGTIGGSSNEGVSVGFKKRKIGNRNFKKREDES